MKGWRVFLLGADASSNHHACASLMSRHPNLSIVGHRDGYFQDSDGVVEQINQSQADLLVVAMGSPRQELWIAEHRDRINASLCMGVGGALDVVSGKVKRAPQIVRRVGLEFLYRLVRQPARFRSQLGLPKFAFMVLWHKLVTRASPQTSTDMTSLRPVPYERHDTRKVGGLANAYQGAARGISKASAGPRGDS